MSGQMRSYVIVSVIMYTLSFTHTMSHSMLSRFTHQNSSSGVLGFSQGIQSSVSMLPSPLLSSWQGLSTGSAAHRGCPIKTAATAKVAAKNILDGSLRFLIEF